MGTMDPTFNPVITDDSAAFSQKAVQAMEKERSQMQLDDSYQLLAQMTDYKDSPSCKEKQQCSLTEAKDAFREGANKQGKPEKIGGTGITVSNGAEVRRSEKTGSGNPRWRTAAMPMILSSSSKAPKHRRKPSGRSVGVCSKAV